MYIYLAHPIDQLSYFRAQHGAPMLLGRAIVQIADAAKQQGHGLFRPTGAHSLPEPPWESELTDKVNAICRNAIWEADALIAILPPGVPTLGTPSEIEHALMLNRPTLLVTTAEFYHKSVQIQGWNRRGANILLQQPDGTIHDLDLTRMLSSLPDPTMLVTDIESDHPALLVTGEAANARAGAYPGDAGIDLALAETALIAPGAYGLFRTGVRAAIPEGYFGWITGRSSTWTKHRCDVRTGIIDSGYRGELMVGLENRGTEAAHFMPGTRLAQLILLPTWQGVITPVDELPAAVRGEAGYGSSGH